MPTGESDSGSRAPIIGRRIGMLVYWILLAAVLGAGASSIIPEAFGLSDGAARTSAEEIRCARGIKRLKASLLEHASVLIRSNSTENAEWLEKWDSRFRALGTGCGALETTRIDLATLRSNLELMSAEFSLSQKGLMGRIDRAVARYAERDPHEPSTSERNETR